MKKYFREIIIAVDQLGNTILDGWADETISSRTYRTNDDPFWKVMEKIINILFFFQKDHCYNAYLNEIDRRDNFPLPADRK